MSATTTLIQQLVAAGLNQMEIHRRTGIPQFRLSRWGRGKAPIGADDALKLKALADELGVQAGQGDTAASQEASHAS